MSPTRTGLVRAAGCIVWRYGSTEPEVVVVHRPRYDDWSFPKGKVDRGERPITTAAREVEEETGLRVRIGPRLRDDHYVMETTGQPKVVSYWIGHPPPRADVSGYEPNNEIDQVRWMSLSTARERLTYQRDVDLLEEFRVSAFRSSALLVVRHAEAHKRKTWKHDDSERPLSAEGRRTAEDLVPVLAAYGITRVVTSDAVRCVDTVLPYVNAHQAKMRLEPGISEEGASDSSLQEIAAEALKSDKRMALCTHRPVIPRLSAALGFPSEEIDPGAIIVIHRSQGRIVSVEKPD
jgi:8-oxo-dGTP diphosphatase